MYRYPVSGFDKAVIMGESWEGVATMSMSRIGFAGRFGMEVLPMCSMDW